MKYTRALLKISGEALASGFGFDYDKLHSIASQIVAVAKEGYAIGDELLRPATVVVGRFDG